jgi:hypothetical protein
VYIYKLQRSNDLDYLRDQITGFENCGAKSLKEIYQKTYFKLRDPLYSRSNRVYAKGFEKHTYTF